LIFRWCWDPDEPEAGPAACFELDRSLLFKIEIICFGNGGVTSTNSECDGWVSKETNLFLSDCRLILYALPITNFKVVGISTAITCLGICSSTGGATGSAIIFKADLDSELISEFGG
jgi:hypothetical protein